MSWLQAHITTTKADTAFFEALLDTLGAVSITLSDAGDEPQLEPAPGEEKIWSDTIVTGLFDAATDQQKLATAINQAAAKQQIPISTKFEKLQDQQWERAWMDAFKPMQFGQRLWVVPEGMQIPEGAQQAVIIKLDPGLAFGTGTHATTSLCLQWLDQANVSDKQVIDYGCGSGILAIAALKLGAQQVIAVDHDEQALIATQSNAQNNAVSGNLELLLSDKPLDQQCDILLANILASVLVELAESLKNLVSAGGSIVLSGILADQTEMVAAAYRDQFELEPAIIMDGWALISGRKHLTK